MSDGFDETFDQIMQTGRNQIVVLDQSAQTLRGHLTAETSLEDSIALTHALLAVNHMLMAWSQYLLPPREEATVCPACADEEAGEEG